MSHFAVQRAAALLHAVHERATTTPPASTTEDVGVRASIVAWLITPTDAPVVSTTTGTDDADLREALRLLVDDVTHRDLAVDVLVTARRWLQELIDDAPQAATT